ncbi:tyrosine-type recombinase/integrase [Lactobacillus sp. ESL0731]|uniref:tyrosine-type recombinase/integrase n=1 Tax=unclassified Lactobacillus TaxID=2620435 RepID=UPI0023FA0BB1|nr:MULTISPECIES: site-specific integrase [unclassified Lactobacillus]WEV51634.1 tyrosine-type recombinase/integrase [Lactobacillus sp. ESL0700]WEV62763.1 tyrosine-type recombinase/integrase [Lactobacillus sp. ESL0731]
MATFDKRGDVWRARVSFKQGGQFHQKSKSGFKTKRQAQVWASKIEVQKAESDIVIENPTFADYYKKWSEAFRIPGKAANTVSRYRYIEIEIKRYFKQQKMNKITRIQYQDFINQYGKNHSKASVRKTNGIIRGCIKDAIVDHIINNDFTARVNLVYDINRTKEVLYLSVKETQALIAKTKEKLNPRYSSRYMILTAIYTGMRIGEIMALTWKDINFKAKTISITKSFSYVTGRIKEPKTASSVRTIRVTNKLLNILKPLQKRNEKYVFAKSLEELPSTTACNKKLKELLIECNINKPGFHFHSLRHTHTSILLYEGVDLYAISKRLGHSNMSITATFYAHMIDELKAKSDDHIEEVLDSL